MAWNEIKKRYECDRCGTRIDTFQKIQLCKRCDELLEKEMRKKNGKTQKTN